MGVGLNFSISKNRLEQTRGRNAFQKRKSTAKIDKDDGNLNYVPHAIDDPAVVRKVVRTINVDGK